MKIYVVTITTGYSDERHTYTGGVYRDRDNAEAAARVRCNSPTSRTERGEEVIFLSKNEVAVVKEMGLI